MSEYIFTTSCGENIPVFINNRRGTHNIVLRPHTNPKHEIHISKPYLSTTSNALNFLESKRNWIEKIYSYAPQKTKLGDGDIIDFLDMRILLKHAPNTRINKLSIEPCGNILYIGGAPDMFEHRVRDFIKSELLKKIKEIIHSVPSEFWPKKIALRDTSSRWGSCSSTGTMSFSWRLAFAPYNVMRYVVIHELSHKKHMNHSKEFWKQVHELYGFGVERAKNWLSKNGNQLYRYF